MKVCSKCKKPESRELALANDPIFRGIYGALVTIWEPKTIDT